MSFINPIALDKLKESVRVNFSGNKREVGAHEFKRLWVSFGQLCNCIQEKYKHRVNFVLVLPINRSYTLILAFHKIYGLSENSFICLRLISRFDLRLLIKNISLFLEVVQVKRPLFVNQRF